MNEDYSEIYDFQDAVNAIAWSAIANDLPMPSWIRDDTPGTNLLVLSWTSIPSMRAWFSYFNVRQHRADPPVWAWGWHGWTVLLSVLESGAGGLSEARSSVPVNEPIVAEAFRRVAESEALASAILDPDAPIIRPCGQQTRHETHTSHTRHVGAYTRSCEGWANQPTVKLPAVTL